MTKIVDIPRTGIFAWGQSARSLPLLASGTAAGALDESFSSDGKLELWEVYPEDGAPSGASSSSKPNVVVEDGGFELPEEGSDGLQPKGGFNVGSKFNRLAWGSPFKDRPRGLLAAGMETGELSIYDPDKILAGANATDSTIFSATRHKGPVRGLDFNSGKKQLLASGSSEGEIFIWDMSTISSSSVHYTPGSTASKPGDVTSLAWNAQAEYILASSLSTGYTIIWDLRKKTQIRTLQYSGPSGSAGGPFGGASGSRASMSSVCWHPENPMSVITASEDDNSPIIMVWDLRNSLAPERILTGHDKGILSVSWCKQDPDLLLSCGKDNRTILWNPQSAEILGELPPSNNWSFQTSWNPRNPDILATASFDGKISVNSLQSTASESAPAEAPSASNSADFFDNLGSATPGVSLKQPPRWLRRPTSATFGYGGVLASTSNLPAANGRTQSATVHLRTVATEVELLERVNKLEKAAGDKTALGAFCDERAAALGAAAGGDAAAWKALSSLFDANSRGELVTLLGFSKEEVAAKVSSAIESFKAANPNPEVTAPSSEEPKTSITVPASADEASSTVPAPSSAASVAADQTNSEFSASGLSDATKQTEEVESEATTAPPSLFGDEGGAGTPQIENGADVFSSLGALRSALPDHVLVPHHPQGGEASVAATLGSGASSISIAGSDVNVEDVAGGAATFKIYPVGESEVDRLLTRALVLGDFESAVSLCLSANRFADAILLAVRGGEDLLHRTQKTYFERRTSALPYLRLFQSIVSDDLSDIVQNADLSEWQEIFVVLCTFAKEQEFNSLAEQLGQRLEHQYRVSAVAEGEDAQAKSKEYRKNATLCYLAARKLEKVVSIWADEMREEEDAAVATGGSGLARYSAHARALQSFIEKVAVFQSATGYVDRDLATTTTSEQIASAGARTYKLASLYERYFEYADLLATQGLVGPAKRYIGLTPAEFRCDGAVGRDYARDRFLGLSSGSSLSAVTPSGSKPTVGGTRGAAAAPKTGVYGGVAVPSAPTSGPYGVYSVPAAATPAAAPVAAAAPPPPPSSTSSYTPYDTVAASAAQPYGVPKTNAAFNDTAPHAPSLGAIGSQASKYGVPASSVPTGGIPNANNQYGAPYGFSQPPQQRGSAALPPPPPRGLSTAPPPIPAAQRRDIPGWNDPPAAKVAPGAGSRPSSALAGAKPPPITSPFPNSSGSMTPPPPQGGAGLMSPPQGQLGHQQQGSFFPPPPQSGSSRAGSRSGVAPPPRGAAAPPPPPPAATAPPPPRAVAPPPRGAAPPVRTASPLGPPGRVLSPSQQPPRLPSANMAAAAARSPSTSSSAYAPPPPRSSTLSPAANTRAPPLAAAVAPPPPMAPAAPAPPPRHPAGDRSHIKDEDLPIFEQIQFLFDHVRSLPPPNPQIANELTRIPAKLELLYDRLNNSEVSADLSDKLRTVARAMENRRLDEAYPFLLAMIANTQFDGLLPAVTSLKLLMSIAMQPPQ